MMVRRGEESKRKRIEGEQRRRSDIRDLLDALKRVLPPEPGVGAGSYGRAQSDTLQHAANRIQELNARRELNQSKLEQLQRESALQLSRYKELTGSDYPGDLDPPDLPPRKQSDSDASSSQHRLDNSQTESLPSLHTVIGDQPQDPGGSENDLYSSSHLATGKRRGKQKEQMEQHMHTFAVEASSGKGKRAEQRAVHKSHRYDPLSKGSRPGGRRRSSVTPPVQAPRKRSHGALPLELQPPPVQSLPYPPLPPAHNTRGDPHYPTFSPPARLHSPPFRQQRQPLPSLYRPPPLDSSTSGSSSSSAPTIGPVRTARKPSTRYDPIRDVYLQNDTPATPPRRAS